MEYVVRTRQHQLLFGLPIVLGAFLLFQVQPLVVKTLLPQFGGSAATWTVALLFFQGALLFGYVYAHSAGKFGKYETYIHVIIAAAALFCGLLLKPWLGRTALINSPILGVLYTLTTAIGLPYILLASTSPLLQKFASKFNATPYRYYALSNAASVGALVSFPLLELYLPLRTLWFVWFCLFAFYTYLIVHVHIWIRTHHTQGAPTNTHTEYNPYKDRTVWWVFLGALGTFLLTSVTTVLSEDITATPLVWIIPLGLYLLSFIICFGRVEWRDQKRFAKYTILSALLMTAVVHGKFPYLAQQILAAGLMVFCGCTLIHGELARSKPDSQRLTWFYMCIAMGGVVGGLLSSVGAPLLLPDYLELHLGLIATAILAGYILFQTDKLLPVRTLLVRGYFLPYTGIAILTSLLIINMHTRLAGFAHITRNFYGVLKVLEVTNSPDPWRVLIHGSTNHGSQYIRPPLRLRPTSYYEPGSGIGKLLQTYEKQSIRVGIVGLGTGTLAAYGKPGDEYIFYEIDPAVLALAQNTFTYLADSPARISTHIGDARLVLEHQTAGKFDVLVIDAFSSDAIPVHLLTNEAMRTYLKQLNPGGVLAIHISNRHVNLKPIVGALAKQNTLHLLNIEHNAAGTLETPSNWVLLSQAPEALSRISTTNVEANTQLSAGRVWTDQYSSVLPLLK